jgi:hypothetical protein
MSETKPESVPPFDTSKPGPGSESTIITPTKKMISEDHFAASRNTAATLVREKSDPKREPQQVKSCDSTVTVGTGWRLTKKNPRVAEPSDHLEEPIPKLARPQTAVGLDAKLLEDHLYEEYRRHENHANLAATEKPSTKQERQAPIQKEIDVPSRLCSNSGISSVGSDWRKNRKGRF